MSQLVPLRTRRSGFTQADNFLTALFDLLGLGERRLFELVENTIRDYLASLTIPVQPEYLFTFAMLFRDLGQGRAEILIVKRLLKFAQFARVALNDLERVYLRV